MTDEKIKHYAVAASNELTEVMPQYYTAIDKLKISDKYSDQLKLCQFYADFDAFVAGVINKQIDLAFNSYKPRRNDCSDEEFNIYSTINELVLKATKMAAREYLISGLIVPEISWKTSTGKELGIKSRPNKRYMMPDNIWVRDPSTIELKRSPVPTKVRVYIRIPADDIYFIKNKGKYQDGTEDKELYQSLRKNYPDYIRLIEAGKTQIPLPPDTTVIRRCVASGKVYPTPYLLPALESLQLKRNLKKMDYSIASRVISAIQLITLGSDKFPLTEDDQPLLDELQKQMLWRGQYNNIERVFQLFGNHTLQISWIYPPVDALLDEKKYSQINNDILYALGLPAIITMGENQRSASSQAEFALLPPTETLKSLRRDLEPFIYFIYDSMKEQNKFNNTPAPAFSPIKLYDPAKIASVGESYYQNGNLSATSWLDLADFDFDNEQILRKHEKEVKTELGLDEQPKVPYGSPNIGGPKNTPNEENKPKNPPKNTNLD